MSGYRCPRCGKPIPDWQPIHFSCFFYRVRFLIIGLVALLLIGATAGIITLRNRIPIKTGLASNPSTEQVKINNLNTPGINNHNGEMETLLPAPKPSLTPTSLADKTPIILTRVTATTIPNSSTHLVQPDMNSPNKKWISEVIDDGKDVGLLTSMAINDSGISYIAYFDDMNDDLRYSFGTAGRWMTQILDNGRSTGFFPSLVLDSHGNPNISYYDRKNKSLKFIRQSGIRWEYLTVVENVDVSAISLDLTKNDVPYILFYDTNYSNLMLAQYSANKWKIQYVADGSPDGQRIDLVLDNQGDPHICYYNGGLIYAHSIKGVWQTEVIDRGVGTGIYSSLALDKRGYPHISYYSEADHSLKYVYWNGSSWIYQIVDQSSDVGKYNDIAIDNLGNVHISYYDETNTSLKYANNSTGRWETETVDNQGDTGKYSSIVLDQFNDPHIAYYDETNGHLLYASQIVNQPEESTQHGITNLSGSGFVSTPVLGHVDPDQFIRDYFAGIDNRDYERTWSMLSDKFKKKHNCCNPDGTFQLQSYVDWWNTVKKTEILKVQEINLNNNSATIKVWIRFYYKDGRVIEDNFTYGLIPDPNSNSWKIDE
jgi:hypothetical protein